LLTIANYETFREDNGFKIIPSNSSGGSTLQLGMGRDLLCQTLPFCTWNWIFHEEFITVVWQLLYKTLKPNNCI